MSDSDLLVTPADLAAHMNNITFDGNQQQAIETILRGLQKQLERFLRHPITSRTFTRVAKVDAGTGLFWTHTPLHSITSITYLLDDVPTTVEPVNYVVRDNTLRMLGGYGYSDDITVTYVAGYDGNHPDNEDWRLLILDAAARGAVHRHDNTISVRGGTDGAVQEKDRAIDPNTIRFTQEELDSVRINRRPVVY